MTHTSMPNYKLNDDKPYKPRKKSHSKGSALSMRASHKKEFKDEQGNIQPIKHSVAINEKFISNFSPTSKAKVIKKFEEVLQKIPTHVPSYTPKKNDTQNQSKTAPSTPTIKAPLVVDHSPSAERSTPKGSKVRKIGKIGEDGITIYTNEPPPKKIFRGKLFHKDESIKDEKKIEILKDVITDKDKIETLKKIPRPTSGVKQIEVTLTKKSVDNAPRMLSRNQTKLFNNIGPNKHAEALQESYELIIEEKVIAEQKELSHCAAHRFTGTSGQIIENLMLLSALKNTWMILPEDFVNWLLNEFQNDTFKLVAGGALKEKIIDDEKQFTHISEGAIKYRISSGKGIQENLDLDIVDDGTPFNIHIAKYMDIFKAKIEVQKEKLDKQILQIKP